MRYQKIVLVGGNGYLGNVLSEYYASRAEEVIIISRKPAQARGNITTVVWDGISPGTWQAALEKADLLVNLCGKNVNCRYTSRNRELIVSSRVVPTHLLGKAIEAAVVPPKLWINVTSATIYRHAEDRPQDEATGDIGEGFSVSVCKQWESAFFAMNTPNTRKIALRMGIVLGKKDGVFPRLLHLTKFGLGGKQGSGKQYVAWIHEQDAAAITEWLIEHTSFAGVINCTAPNPVSNKSLMQSIRKHSGIKLGIPSPKWLLEIGALLIGTETELILKSRWVMPGILLDHGFTFQFPEVDAAVKNILSGGTS